MAMERTFSIVKPDAVKAGKSGAIIQHLIDGGLKPIAQKLVFLSEAQAKGFYHVHRERPFFNDLVRFMTSGPCLVQVLEGENAIARNRELMGATDSRKAAPGTNRQKRGTDSEKNAVHGSDAPETAKYEIGFFFAGAELAALGVLP
jgi:nucleoside-diphosphate kinase